MHDDFRIEIQFKVKFKGKKKHRTWSARHWPVVPRVGELMHFDDDVIATVEQVKWESDRSRKPDYLHALAIVYCTVDELEPNKN